MDFFEGGEAEIEVYRPGVMDSYVGVVEEGGVVLGGEGEVGGTEGDVEESDFGTVDAARAAALTERGPCSLRGAGRAVEAVDV